ncbi:glycosyltransferase [Nocardia iowensis]|uniref:Glycosyltransferase n=1 Tax=Nocardia iowensis TaxID=204891 RepID=A0ABX8RVK6_NOCIO|nr:glycosyltransferase [Nocardia iowensis]QXN93668.1 glycosyltransferase [Nocardia iowensis]
MTEAPLALCRRQVPFVGWVTLVGAGIAVGGAGIGLFNRMTVRQLTDAAGGVTEPVTVCVPARDEAERLPGLLADLRVQQGVARMSVLILDDASGDDTFAAAIEAAGGDPRITVLRNDTEPAPGWTGKAAACARLAEAVATPVLVFVDADVRLGPGAVAAAVTELRRRRVALLSPWPMQRAESVAEALVQPLLCWSWAATLPISVANRSLRPSTSVACGQFLVFDTAAYRAVGGHAAVAASATEDLDIARTLRRAGQPTALVGAGRMASTRMYSGVHELDDGYTRWLWSAYGGTIPGGAAVGLLAALGYWVPPLAASCGRGTVRRIGLLGYAAAVTGRLLSRSLETGGPVAPADVVAALAHPLSIAAYLRLWVRSHRARRRGTLRWKGRALGSVGA